MRKKNISQEAKTIINSSDFSISKNIALEYTDFSADIICNLKNNVKWNIVSVELDRANIGLTYNNITKKIEGSPIEHGFFNVIIKYTIAKWHFSKEQRMCILPCEIKKNKNLPQLKFRINNVKQFEEVKGLRIVHYDRAVDHYTIEEVIFLDENENHFVYDKSENVINGFPTRVSQCSLEIIYSYKNLFPGKKFKRNVDFFVLENKQALKLNLFVNPKHNPIKQFDTFSAKLQSNNTNIHAQKWEITAINNFIELHNKGIDINLKNKTIYGNTLFAKDFNIDVEYDVIADKKIYSFTEQVILKVVPNETKLNAYFSSLGTAKYFDFFYNKLNVVSKLTNNDHNYYHYNARIVNVIFDNENFIYNHKTQEILGFINNSKDVNVIIEYDYPSLSELPNLSDKYANTKIFTQKQTIKVLENPRKPILEFNSKRLYSNKACNDKLELAKKPIFANIDPYHIIDVEFNPNDTGLKYNNVTKKITGTPKIDSKEKAAKNVSAIITYTYHRDKLHFKKWSELVKLRAELKITIYPEVAKTTATENSNDKYRKENSANEFINGKEKKLLAARQCINTNHLKDNHCENDFHIKYHEQYDCYIAVIADGLNDAKFSYYASKLVVNVAGEILYNNLEKNLPSIESTFKKFYQENADSDDNNNDDFEKNIKRVLYNLIGISVFTSYKKLEQEYNTNKAVIGDIKNLSTTLLISIVKKIDDKWLCVSYSIGDGVIAIYDKNSKESARPLLLANKISNNVDEHSFLSKKDTSTYEDIIKCINVAVVDDFTALIMMNSGISKPKFKDEINLNKNKSWNDFWKELNKEIPSLSNVENSNELTAKELMQWLNFVEANQQEQSAENYQNDRVLAMIY